MRLFFFNKLHEFHFQYFDFGKTQMQRTKFSSDYWSNQPNPKKKKSKIESFLALNDL